MKTIILLSAFVTFAAPVAAQTVTLTVKDGRALVVGGTQDLGVDLSPTKLSPEEIVLEFQRLCLPDPSSAVDRVNDSPLTLEENEAVFEARGKQGEARVQRWKGKAAELSLWFGDGDNLKKLPIAMPSRGGATTGPYGPFKAFGEQCNLVIMMSGFQGVAPLTQSLTQSFGEPGKLVLKKTFADGHWWVANADKPWRININAPSTKYGPQPVHISVQLMDKWPKKKKKRK